MRPRKRQPLPDPPQHALDRVRRGLCLVPGCDAEPLKRGLCAAHYQRFRVTKISRLRRGDAFEHRLISDGLLLPPQAVREATNPNPFAGIAAEVDADADKSGQRKIADSDVVASRDAEQPEQRKQAAQDAAGTTPAGKDSRGEHGT